MMSRLKMGMIAGLAGTVAVAVLEVGNQLIGHWFTPFPEILAGIMGMPDNLALGWAVHVLMGIVVLGGAFGMLYHRLPTDTPGTRGIVFAVGTFVILLTGIMLFGNSSLLTGDNGFGTIAWLLITNVVFGLVMGIVYGQRLAREKRIEREAHDGVPAH